jgi:hypothetical protein
MNPDESTEHTGTADELRDELRARGLPTSGTKPELIERLAADDVDVVRTEVAEADDEAEEVTEEEAEQAEAIADADLVSDDGEVNTDQVATFTDDARAAIAEFTERLENLGVVLADVQARNADPASGALMDAAAKVRAHMDDVQRHLGPLSAGIQALQNATLG